MFGGRRRFREGSSGVGEVLEDGVYEHNPPCLPCAFDMLYLVYTK